MASARYRATAYAGLGLKEKEADARRSSKEKEARREQFRERYTPGARAMPTSVTGLAALANERCVMLARKR